MPTFITVFGLVLYYIICVNSDIRYLHTDRVYIYACLDSILSVGM